MGVLFLTVKLRRSTPQQAAGYSDKKICKAEKDLFSYRIHLVIRLISKEEFLVPFLKAARSGTRPSKEQAMLGVLHYSLHRMVATYWQA